MKTNLTISNVQASAVATLPNRDIANILFGEVCNGILKDAFEAMRMADVGQLYREAPGHPRQFVNECILEDLRLRSIRVDEFFDYADLCEMRAAFILANIEAEAEAARDDVREAFAKLAN